MDTAILSSVIGASAVMLATMLGVIFSRISNALSETNRRIDGIYEVLRGHASAWPA